MVTHDCVWSVMSDHSPIVKFVMTRPIVEGWVSLIFWFALLVTYIMLRSVEVKLVSAQGSVIIMTKRLSRIKAS